MFVLHSLDDCILIPTHVAICPECGGRLEALIDAFDPLVPGVNVYQPSEPVLYCQNENTIEHDSGLDCEWFEAYDRVAEWLRKSGILFKAAPAEIAGLRTN